MTPLHEVNEKSFCIAPWDDVRVWPDGRLNYCHTSYLHSDRSDNIQTESIDEFYHNTFINSIRSDIISNVPVHGCSKCRKVEEKTEISYRHKRNLQLAIFPGKHFKKSFDESIAINLMNDTNLKPRFYSIGLSNLCNIQCIMCDELSSSKIASEYKRINFKTINNIHIDWTKNEECWQKFLTHIKENQHIECIHFNGGEPLLHKKFNEFLDFCIANNHTQFHLTVVTNSTIFNIDQVKKFKQFKSFQIELSIESVNRLNDYIRYPTNTNIVLENIIRYLEHRTEKFDIVIRTVPQLLSVIDYVDIIDFCLKHKLVIDSNVIHTPEFLKPNILTAELKSMVIQELTAKMTELSKLIPTNNDSEFFSNINNRNSTHYVNALIDNIKRVIDCISEPIEETQRINLVNDAKVFFNTLDKSRGLGLEEFSPKIFKMIESYGNF